MILAESFKADVAARARSQSKHSNRSTKRSLDKYDRSEADDGDKDIGGWTQVLKVGQQLELET